MVAPAILASRDTPRVLRVARKDQSSFRVTVGALETNEPGLGDAGLEVALDGALHEAGDRAALRLRRLDEAGPPALDQRMQDAPARVPRAVGLDALLHELDKGQPRAATKGLGIERECVRFSEFVRGGLRRGLRARL